MSKHGKFAEVMRAVTVRCLGLGTRVGVYSLFVEYTVTDPADDSVLYLISIDDEGIEYGVSSQHQRDSEFREYERLSAKKFIERLPDRSN